MAFSFQKLNFLFIIYNSKRDRFLCTDVVHVRTLVHINYDVAQCAMSTKTETTGSQQKSGKLKALWSPAGKELTSRLSFMVSYCDVVTFPLVSWVGCGA